MEEKGLVHRDDFVDKNPLGRRGPLPPNLLDFTGVFARCPKCGRITNIRTCYGCRDLMCENCLIEHQIVYLHKESKEIQVGVPP